MHNASCKTALDLLPLSKRSNRTQNEKSNEEVYKEKLEDFKLQLTEIEKFLDNPKLTEDQLRPFKEEIPKIVKNISEISYLITDKSSKLDSGGVTISIQPKPIKLTHHDLDSDLTPSSPRANKLVDSAQQSEVPSRR